MFLYLLVFVLAVNLTPGEAERCSGYTEYGGHYRPGFNCPGRYDDRDEIYCCGTSKNKYCCDDCWDKVYGACHRYYGFSMGGKVGVGLAVSGFLLILVAIAYCCRAKQLRQRRNQRQTVTTVPYPGQEQTQYPPPGAMSYLPPPSGGAAAYPQSTPAAYPQPPPGGFVAAPPPYPGGDAAYPPAYPGGPAYPEKQQP
ncbi:PREDICTED: protein shisa-4-like [Branchiostoma belcheri]|uniref:Protein shisa-4-like n=1 Tax=Branchiostoma belcheri TaxID=7741 RepID=A0A6P4XYI6_BRABE|nr:PREDICTED: protein shisa-4-like [Branchiostoma belcheri]